MTVEISIKVISPEGLLTLLVIFTASVTEE